MAVDTVEYNPFLPQVRADPYPSYHRLRSHDPVHRSRLMPLWVVTRYRDVAQLLREPHLSADRTNWREFVPLEGVEVQRSMLFLDPPDHTRLRALVSKAFTPRVVERLRPRVEEIVDGILERAARAGTMELVSELAYPLPVTVIAELLGVPTEDWPRFREWSRVLVGSLDPLVAPDFERLRSVLEARDALTSYLAGIVTRRRNRPREDLISALIAVEEAGRGLSERELLVMLNLLLVAGHETTVNLIGNGVLALLRHPDQLERLRSEPGLIETALEELLRWDSPVQLTSRVALQDFQLDGKEIRRGELVLALIGAANRDPEQFPDPDRLDLGRDPNPHLSFGRGIHFCLGAPLARLEGQIAIGQLVSRFPRLRLAGEPERSPTITLRGLRNLRLALT